MQKSWLPDVLYGGLVATVVAILTPVILFYLVHVHDVSLRDIGLAPGGISLVASVVEIVGFLVAIAFAITALISRYLRRGWRLTYATIAGSPIGVIPIADDQVVIRGLVAQKTTIEDNTSWPPHASTASAAKRSSRVNFGDAAFTLSRRQQTQIQKFIGRPTKLRGPEPTDKTLLVVTGEPGAGKSIVLQEIQASLTHGIEEHHQFLIPIVIFACDLRSSDLAVAEYDRVSPFRKLTTDCLRASANPHEKALGDFVASHWDQHDFLLIVDGLDEIAQRDDYTPLQTKLKQFIEHECARPNRRTAHRFILSCRLEDDIAVFHESSQLVLQGLKSERARRRFCANVISGLRLTSRTFASNLEKFLDASSARLASAEVFRRNPYFLTLLINYFQQREGKTTEPLIDFEFLMDQCISREIERRHATGENRAASSQSFTLLKNELLSIATTFLEFFAFHSASILKEDSLYGRCQLTDSLIAEFISISTRFYPVGRKGSWPFVSELLHSLARDGQIDEQRVNSGKQYLAANDTRILASLVLKLVGRPRPLGDLHELVFGALGDTPYGEIVQTVEWYRELAAKIAETSRPMIHTELELLAVLLFARGLMAAHVLRLVYVEEQDGALCIRFRHRRVAEYYAARYFRAEWQEREPPPSSPWLTPILNLVCAIEGEQCLAFKWIVDRVTVPPAVPPVVWRYCVVATGEAAAFAHRGVAYASALRDAIVRLVGVLANHPHFRRDDLSGKWEPLDLITELTIVNTLDFLAQLEVNVSSLPDPLPMLFTEAGYHRPPDLVVYFAKAQNAVARLTQWYLPLLGRARRVGLLLVAPGTVIERPMQAWRLGIFKEWTAVAIYVALVELSLVASGALLAALVLRVLIAALGNQDFEESLTAYTIIGAALVLYIRTFAWLVSPSSAAEWNAVPARLVAVFASLLATTAKGVLVLAKRIAVIYARRTKPEFYRASTLRIPAKAYSTGKAHPSVQPFDSGEVVQRSIPELISSALKACVRLPWIILSHSAKGLKAAAIAIYTHWPSWSAILKANRLVLRALAIVVRALFATAVASLFCLLRILMTCGALFVRAARWRSNWRAISEFGRQIGMVLFDVAKTLFHSTVRLAVPATVSLVIMVATIYAGPLILQTAANQEKKIISWFNDLMETRDKRTREATAHSEHANEQHVSATAKLTTTEPVTPGPASAPSIPEDSCEMIGGRAQEILDRYGQLTDRASSNVIQSMRTTLTSALRDLTRSNQGPKCIADDSKGDRQLVEEHLVDALFDRDPRLMPLPESGELPIVGRLELESVSKYANQVDPPSPKGLLERIPFVVQGYVRTSEEMTSLNELETDIISARRTGRVGVVAQTEYPTKEMYPQLAFRTKQSLLEARVAHHVLSGTRAMLWNELLKLIPMGVIVFVLLPVLIWTVNAIRRIHKENRFLERIRHEPLRTLVEFLTNSDLSERVRRGIQGYILNLTLKVNDMTTIESAVQRLVNRGTALDLKIAVELSNFVDSVGRRITHSA